MEQNQDIPSLALCSKSLLSAGASGFDLAAQRSVSSSAQTLMIAMREGLTPLERTTER